MSGAEAPAPPRRRPRDRRQSIEAAAAAAFAERGYHRVAMQDVADAVGITAAALYRHFANKYDLFSSVAMGLVQGLHEAADEVPTPAERTPDEARREIDALLEAWTVATLGMRTTGGIYRWESRYLHDDDRRALRDEFAALRERLGGPVGVLRPELDAETLDLVCRAALSAIASVTMHRTAMPGAALRALLEHAAGDALACAVDPVPAVSSQAAEPSSPPRRRRDQLAQAGIALFGERGYHDVTIEDIAGVVGLTPSGVYRHFAGKAEILRTACERAAAVLDAAAEEALGGDEPLESLRVLERAYIAFAVDDRDLMDVYTADVGALDAEDQRRLRRLQREHVDDWVELLGAVRPDLEPREARTRVHAGLNVVADLAVALRHRPAADAKAWIRPMLEAVLGV
ncbi:TetR/AcrR family transcriptional regulator [Demequina sp. SYSU T00039]|uniref:TetR/AcrR family transcriptional regulator n=1 Tax=Demequina lignilytica TaxID=3051663 RepID=A0AAW7M1H4_9MICO|nr:TetR/AcrR family transcriptional regulator [Demequina sp. SYSU T00039]MDN4486882.1 TetR/AcrR family transcriptional regulator [Demequina sp. SYSU T00039]